jgi:translation initiation factor 2A
LYENQAGKPKKDCYFDDFLLKILRFERAEPDRPPICLKCGCPLRPTRRRRKPKTTTVPVPVENWSVAHIQKLAAIGSMMASANSLGISARPALAVEGPPLAILVREKSRAYLTPFPYDVGSEGAPGASLPEMRDDPDFSADGSMFVGIEGVEQKVVIRTAGDGNVVTEFGGELDKITPLKVNFVCFSPKASYVLAWARPVRGVDVPNLVLYDTRSGAHVTAFHQKTFHKDFWPTLQWSDDETVAARMVSNTIHFFGGANIGSAPTGKLHIPDISSFVLSRGPAPYAVAVFVAGKTGGPGRISVHQHPDQGGELLLQRSTFRADAVTFKWSPAGTACLALVSTNVDATGKSYYGESEVYYLDLVKKTQDRLELPQEGPTYDVAWSPTGNEFIIIYGFMPARATMFNAKCEPEFDFGTGSRNTVSFSPHGRYVALAGFGNLNGGIQFWDKNKRALVGSTSLSCTTSHCWSPCSRYFLAATTFPRLRVDNGFRIIRFDGKTVHEHKLGETCLLQASFVPSLRSAYQDPKLTASLMIGGSPQEPGSNGAPHSGANGAEVKKSGGAYRPPGARGTEASFSLHRNLEAGAVDKTSFMAANGRSTMTSIRTSPAQRVIPGLDMTEAPDAAPSKAAMKRKKKKEKEQRQIAEGSCAKPGPAPGSDNVPRALEDLDTVEAATKRMKNLKKKLRQIELLKASIAEGQKEINEDQQQKLGSEKDLAEQLAQVERRLEELSLRPAT